MQKIKIFGERNTGTNYLQQLILANLEAEVMGGGVPVKRGWMRSPLLFDLLFDLRFSHLLGWKHSFPNHRRIRAREDLSNILFVTLTKNPYPFLVSLFNRPYHYHGKKPADFALFLKQEWKMLKRENAPVKAYPSPVHLWNEKNRAYLTLKMAFPENTLNITYEQLVEDPGKVIGHLSEVYRFGRFTNELVNVTSSTKNDNKSFTDYQLYSSEERWQREISPEAYRIIKTFLDRELVDFFGYQIAGC